MPPGAAGERLDVFLAAPRRLALGRAAADRRRARHRRRRRGARSATRSPAASASSWRRPTAAPAPEAPPAPFAVAWEDEHVLVVDKPPGVVVHPARGHRSGTLVQALAGRVAGGDDPDRPGVVHRLDRDTSGLLVLARTEAAHAALKARAGGARRSRASTWRSSRGGPPALRGTIDAPLGRDRRGARGSRPTRTSRGPPSPTSRSSARCRPTRSCASASRRAARTRSARTCWPSAIRWRATAGTAAPAATGSGASSCTRRGSASRIPCPASGSSSRSPLPADLDGRAGARARAD